MPCISDLLHSSLIQPLLLLADASFSSASSLLLFRMPRLVRRRTLRDRLLSYLNPLDLALDLYTCIESYDWDGVQSTTSTPIGLALNILLFIARVNCSRTSPSAYNDVLLTQPQKYGWDTGSKLGYSVCNGNLVRHVSRSLGDNLLRGLMGWRAHWGVIVEILLVGTGRCQYSELTTLFYEEEEVSHV